MTLQRKMSDFIGDRSRRKPSSRLRTDFAVMTYLSPSLKTRLYLDSSSVGTQARVAQKRHIDKEDVWRPVNYTSRAWTSAEAGYGQIERESNGILTGMHITRCILLAHMLRS